MSINRDRAWRRFQQYNKGNKSYIENIWKPEKNWKMLYTRSVKIQRARQLGFEYPRKTFNQILANYE